MAKRSASLLTKTQRQRLRNGFESVDRDAKQRDQQLIRERIRAGILDFTALTDYPDSQYKLAFKDVSDEELRTALADTYLAAERIRALHRYDRDQLLQEARTHAEDVSAEASDVSSLDRLDLRTTAEVQKETKERLGRSGWEQYARTLVKLTTGAAIIGYLIFLNEVAIRLGVVSLILIGVLAVKQYLIPALVTLAKQAHKVVGTAWRR